MKLFLSFAFVSAFFFFFFFFCIVGSNSVCIMEKWGLDMFYGDRHQDLVLFIIYFTMMM